MSAKPVEAVLVVYYGPEAHRATYGRDVQSNRYTKDYIQLSRKQEFLEMVHALFPAVDSEEVSVPLTYHWPTGTASGSFVFHSGDRPHLKWETKDGAPKVWKMALKPGENTSETIPGDPDHLLFEDAENEFAELANRGAGQPYLLAIKLKGEPRKLHLRVYLGNADPKYDWASVSLLPSEIQELASNTTQRRALQWSYFYSGGEVPTEDVTRSIAVLSGADSLDAEIAKFQPSEGANLVRYLKNPGYGLYLDPARNHDGWLRLEPLDQKVKQAFADLLPELESRYSVSPQGDAVAEALEVDAQEVEQFLDHVENENYAVSDADATTKTRGSAQRVFAKNVKENYEFSCAVTGISTKEFLIASHIVPWHLDQSIRLDPSNGICLSPLFDRAFEEGYVIIEDDLSIRLDRPKIGDDDALLNYLKHFEGSKLRLPKKKPPNPEYLKRRRAIIAA